MADQETAKEMTMAEDLQGELVHTPTLGGVLARRAPRDVVLMPVMDVRLARQRFEELQAFCAEYLQESKDGGNDGGDYGIIPGAGKKKVLHKSGADKLCDIYGLADTYVILTEVEDWERGLFDYKVQCRLVRKTDEMFVGSGLGSCSSWEAKYRYRQAQRVCPQCSKETIIKGKEEYGGGYICWKNKGGCGAKFSDNDPAITDQKIGRVENPDIYDTKNTVLKMAKKRAKVDAVISVTRSSGIFTQDLEDLRAEAQHDEESQTTTTTTSTSTSTSATAVAAGAPKQPGESQADYVARVKADAAAKAKPEPVKPADQPKAAEPAKPTEKPAPVPAAKPTPVANGEPVADGYTRISSINVKNGPSVMKDGEAKPSWLLYIIAFNPKLKASDGKLVGDASTLDEVMAGKIEQARDASKPVKLKIEPGKKQGNYSITGFEA